MSARDPHSRFEVKLGRIKSPSGHERVTGFLKSVGRPRSGTGSRHCSKGRTRSVSAKTHFQRRVLVKVSIVRMDGKGAGAQRHHLKYIQRDSAAPEGERGGLYDRDGRDVDVKAFEDSGRNDRHQFRIIVSPEDSERMNDLSGFTRDLMHQMEKDLGTKLNWVAADHYDTDQPHTHIVVQGKRDDGCDLVMPRRYVSHGIRERAQALVEIELGPVRELEGRQRFARMVRQDRLTQLDRHMLARSQNGILDLSKPARRGQVWRRQLEKRRLSHLQRMGLATALPKGRWKIDATARDTLQRMGQRGDIIKAMHRAMTETGPRRVDAASLFDPSEETARAITGRIVRTGVSDDVRDRAFIVVDTLQGRSAYVEIGPTARLEDVSRDQIVTVHPLGREPRPSDRTIHKVASANNGTYAPRLHLDADPKASPDFVQAHVRRLEALRRSGLVTRHKDGRWTIPDSYLEQAADYERHTALTRPVNIAIQSKLPLSKLTRAIGATWLDRRMEAFEADNTLQGFGSEVAQAIAKRRQFLFKQTLLKSVSSPVDDKVLKTLEIRDLKAAGDQLSSEMGKPFTPAPDSGRVSGTLRGVVDRPSGRYAILEKSREFTLVPWRDLLDGRVGQSVSGLVRNGSVSWRFGRTRGIS